jgi:hypothetical protein
MNIMHLGCKSLRISSGKMDWLVGVVLPLNLLHLTQLGQGPFEEDPSHHPLSALQSYPLLVLCSQETYSDEKEGQGGVLVFAV